MTDYVPQNLVNAFVVSVGRHFQTLEQCYSLRRLLSAVVFGDCRIQKVKPEEIGNRFFMLELSLKGSNFSVIISYGDREHDLECRISRRTCEETYALWEWIEALGKRELFPEDSGGWVLTETRVETIISRLDHILKQLAPAIASADSSIEYQLKQRREERVRLGQQKLTEDEHQRLAFKATEAFHRQDYRTVVDALSNVKCELTASEQAKLAYARKQLRS